MEHTDDILTSFEILEISEESPHNKVELTEPIVFVEEKQMHITPLQKIREGFIFMLKYIGTSISIFAVLLVISNYSAYLNLAYSVIYAQELEDTKNSMNQSLAASNISENEEKQEKKEVNSFKALEHTNKQVVEKKNESIHSINQLIQKSSNSAVNLGIEITPYENRIVIPKIGKNIPLLDIKQKKVDWIDELNNIFMDELENGVIRYPGSAKPGENGNAFIFGHSSNFPWVDGDYNDVFALLDKVSFDDEVVVYYGQEKYVYKIRTKDVIRPGDVSVLKNKQDKSQLTLMTCWPIGTTLNRLVLTADLIEIK